MRSLRHLAVLALAPCLACGEADLLRGTPDDPIGDLHIPGDRDYDSCRRTQAGAATSEPLILALSRAHAMRRFMGVHGGYRDVDESLSRALEDPAALTRSLAEALDSYVQGDPSACSSLAAVNTALAPASLEMLGDVARIRPGTGQVVVPDDARGIVIDLRGLPNIPETREALARAVAPALDEDVRWLTRSIRSHLGMTDEVYSAANVYQNEVIDVEGELIIGEAAERLPLALLTDDRMVPPAAELAALLRLSNRAWLFGSDVLASVAETEWVAIADRGVMMRVSDMKLDDARIPDVIAADRTDADAAVELLLHLDEPSHASWGADVRRMMLVMTPFGDHHLPDSGLGVGRAALITAHAAVRTFFPYFHVVGDEIDPRLIETMAAIEGSDVDRTVIRDALRRFAHALSDGHAMQLDYGQNIDPEGIIPVVVEHIDGEPVVRRSLIAELAPGDTIVSIDGTPMSEFYADASNNTSAATEGYRLSIASRRWRQIAQPVEVLVRASNGELRHENVEPSPKTSLDALGFAPSQRAAGWLADVGAPTLYYINLSQDVLQGMDEFRAALTEAQSAAGLVLDMRGYPVPLDQLEYVARVVPGNTASPQFILPQVDVNGRTTAGQAYYIEPLSDPSFAGPVALIVGPNTVSAAENLSMMLVDAQRVTVVGRNSAATNGNITGVQLPSGLGFMFTGMEVLHADGASFHAIGIVPQITASLSASELASGIDPELEAAIDSLAPF